jgi:hypothetical protein
VDHAFSGKVPVGQDNGFSACPIIIRHAAWLYFGFTLSFREVEDLLTQRMSGD